MLTGTLLVGLSSKSFTGLLGPSQIGNKKKLPCFNIFEKKNFFNFQNTKELDTEVLCYLADFNIQVCSDSVQDSDLARK